MKKRLTLTVNQEVAKNLVKAKTDCLVVGVNAGSTMNEVASNINKATNGFIKKLIQKESSKLSWTVVLYRCK